MSVPFFDLTRQYQQIGPELEQAVREVLSSGHYILGERVARFEREAAAYLGVEHAIGVASGTDALRLSLLALGIGAGDEVITPPFTFFATAEMITATGASPVFVDIDPVTFNIDPGALEAAITPRTRAIMPVHLFGLCAEMDLINTIADRHHLAVIEDAAQAFGAKYHDSRAGSLGTMSCFSFFPTKNLGACGDGGLVTTSDARLADRVRLLRSHGSQKRYVHSTIGMCSRLDAVQAAVLSVKLACLDGWNERRRQIAAQYHELLKGAPVVMPGDRPGVRHIYHQFTISTSQRARLIELLTERGIGHMIYYPIPLHLQEAYTCPDCPPASFPIAERASQEVISLPIFPELTPQEVSAVAQAVRDALG